MSIHNKLFLDIETLPPSGGGHFERIRANVTAPGQYKKPESIAQWLAENGDAVAQEEFGKLGLNGLYGEIACICWTIGDGPIFTGAQMGGVSEASMLDNAFRAIDQQSIGSDGRSPLPLIAVGHNVSDFDLRFLMHRAIRHGVKLPRCLRKAYETDGRYDVFDTMKKWSGYRGYVKLKDLSRELLGDTTDDIDGSEVAKYWATDPMKVIEHCQADVARVRDLYKRFAAVL